MLDKIILGILNLKDGQTVYDLKKAMDRSINHFYTTSYGSIHPALIKMEKKGLVRIHEEVVQGRTRKVYFLEDEGRREFSRWLDSDIEPVRIRESSLVRIFFFGMLEKENRERIISAYLEEIDKVRSVLEAMKSDYSGKDIPSEFRDVARYQMETLNFGIDHSDFLKDWFEEFLDKENMEQ